MQRNVATSNQPAPLSHKNVKNDQDRKGQTEWVMLPKQLSDKGTTPSSRSEVRCDSKKSDEVKDSQLCTSDDLLPLSGNQTSLPAELSLSIMGAPEGKHFYVSAGIGTVTNNASGVLISLSQVGFGDGLNQRVGDAIRCKHVRIKALLYVDGSFPIATDATSGIVASLAYTRRMRFIVFRDKFPVIGTSLYLDGLSAGITPPTSQQSLMATPGTTVSTGIVAQKNIITSERYHIYHDKTYELVKMVSLQNTYAVPSAVVNGAVIQLQGSVYLDLFIPLHDLVEKWRDATSASAVMENEIKICMFADYLTTTGCAPSYTITSDLEYNDF